MAVLSSADRAAGCAKYMRDLCAARETIGPALKADLQAAFNALDAFMDANAAAVNNAIPLPARTVLTVPQKARLLEAVIFQRYISGA